MTLLCRSLRAGRPMPETPLFDLVLELLLEFILHGLSSSRSRTVIVLVVSTVRIMAGRPSTVVGLLDDGLANSFLTDAADEDDLLTLVVVVSAFFVATFLSADEKEDDGWTRGLDVAVDLVDAGSAAALRLVTGVVGLWVADVLTGRFTAVVLASSLTTFSPWISFSSCRNSVTESS